MHALKSSINICFKVYHQHDLILCLVHLAICDGG
jgi:hypothetical protein